MRTVTLKISDDYFDKFMGFIELLPKKAVRVESGDKQKEVETLKKELSEAFLDVKLGRTIKTNKKVELRS